MMHHVSQKSSGAPLTSEIIRAGRMLLRWDQKALAEAASVSHVTVRRLEAKPGPLVADRSTIAQLRSALESAGIAFVEENGSVNRVAARLYAHRNTILRRMTRAKSLLPRPLAENPVQVAAALQVLRWTTPGVWM